MAPRLSSLRARPLLLAAGGASAHAPSDTNAAVTLAMALGATGIATQAWLTADRKLALHGSGRIGRVRRRSIASLTMNQVAESALTLHELIELCGPSTEFLIRLGEEATITALLEAIRSRPSIDRHQTTEDVDDVSVGRPSDRFWISHTDIETLAAWRSRWSDIRLLHDVRLANLDAGPERHGAILFDHGIDGTVMHASDWTGGLTALYHRFGRYCFADQVALERVATELLDAGVDALIGPDVERLVGSLDSVYGPTS